MDAEDMEPFSFGVDEFDINWLMSGPRKGMAQKFVAHLNYRETPDGEEKQYDLKVNHPLSIGGTDLFLIGHGYAPSITVRDGNGDVAYSGPVIFLPEEMATFTSFGVLKPPTPGRSRSGSKDCSTPRTPTSTATRSPCSATTATRGSRCWPTSATSAWTPGSRSRSTCSTRTG